MWLRKRQSIESPEQPKVVIRRDLVTAILSSWVHLIPVGATTALCFFNLNGYFVGESLSGSPNQTDQTFYQFLLQFIAKMMVLFHRCRVDVHVIDIPQELLIIASLGMIITDVLQHLLIFSERGVPLRIVAAKFGFTDLSYFWSPEFYSGSIAFKSKMARCLCIVALVGAGVITVLAGPSTAVLLIPSTRTDWQAGGLNFWLNGSTADLWPTRLTRDHVGGDHCVLPSQSQVLSESLADTGCIWGGHNQIYQYYRGIHGHWGYKVDINDGLVSRIHNMVGHYASALDSSSVVESMAAASSAAIALAQVRASDAWSQSLWYNPTDRRIKISHRNLEFRKRVESNGYVTR